jgi:hypothetical protein
MKTVKYLPIFFCALLAAFFTYFPITDTDIFWHLAAGREMVAHKNFLFTDPFSFSLASPKWIDLHWLFQLLVYGLYCLGRFKAILAFKAVAVACVVSIISFVYRDRPYVLTASFCAALFFFEVRYLVLERPVLITLLCMSFYLFLFEHVRQGGRRTWLWLCIPLQMVWTNSQGLYPIGLFIIGAYWIEELARTRIRALSALHFGQKHPSPYQGEGTGMRFSFITYIFLASCLSCLATPYGISGIALPFTLFSRISPDVKNIYSMNISENVPLFSLSGFEAVYRTVCIVTALLVIILFAVNRKRVRTAHVILFLGFSYLAYSAVRNVLLYLVVAVFVIAYYVSRIGFGNVFGRLSAKSRLALAAAGLASGAVCLAGPVFIHASTVATYPPHRSLSPFRFPEDIVSYVKQHPVEGEMFNDIRYGGYLIWHLYPQKKVLIDGRLVIRSPQFFAEYLAVCDRPELFPFVVKKFNITHAILPSAIFGTYLKLIRYLYASGLWHLEYTDGSSVLFVRNDVGHGPALDLSDPKTAASIAEDIRTRWHDAPYVREEALGYFADQIRNVCGEKQRRAAE